MRKTLVIFLVFTSIFAKAQLSEMDDEYDEYRRITFYYDSKTHGYFRSALKTSYIYIGKEDGKPPYLRMVIRYKGSSWLFIKEYYFLCDGRSIYLKVKEDMNRKVLSDASITETYDAPVDKDIMYLCSTIANSEEVSIKCIGTDYAGIIKLNKKERKSFERVLIAYKMLQL